jgi:16S rRNA (cytosine1402-N4)-methyltransferase
VPEFFHKPVLLAEVLQALQPRAGGHYCDGTAGGGGHSEAILRASAPDGWLYGCDRDSNALLAAAERLAPYAGRFELRQMNFADLATWIPPSTCDGVLLDLGVSSHQLSEPERGFSFQHDGPLDMRMDPRQGTRAADLISELSEAELAEIFWKYGEETQSRRFAKAMVKEREARRIETTRQLAQLIERLSPRRGQARHPATQVFQALRIAVNDEWSSLRRGLAAALSILRPGGRLAVITFHSLEDRIVKEFGREKARDYAFEGPEDVPELRRHAIPQLRWVNRKAIKPGSGELSDNPRARSAQLRVMEKL